MKASYRTGLRVCRRKGRRSRGKDTLWREVRYALELYIGHVECGIFTMAAISA